MKKKWKLAASIFQLVVGVAAIGAFLVAEVAGEPMGKWIVTLLLAMGYVILGSLGICDARKNG